MVPRQPTPSDSGTQTYVYSIFVPCQCCEEAAQIKHDEVLKPSTLIPLGAGARLYGSGRWWGNQVP